MPMLLPYRALLGELVSATSAGHCLEVLGATRAVTGYEVVGFRDSVDAPVARRLSGMNGLSGRFGWPAEFLASWIAEGLGDHYPVTEEMRRPGSLCEWTLPDPDRLPARSSLLPQAARTVRHMRRFGLCEGLTIPVSRPFGRVGCVTWLIPSRREAIADRSESRRLLLAIAQRFFEGIDAWRLWQPHSVLTSRETECLYWAARGKSDKEIARLIGRSMNTARFHMKAIIRKLGAVNRTHAVALGVAAGLVDRHALVAAGAPVAYDLVARNARQESSNAPRLADAAIRKGAPARS